MNNSDDLEVNEELGWPFNWINWCQTSSETLRDAETDILSNLKTAYTTRYCSLGPLTTTDSDKEDIKVWTLSINEDLPGIPIVLLHGLGSGLALWVLNLDQLSKLCLRPIFAIDLPGFGRSSRPFFSTNPNDAEQEFVQVIESWRSKMNLDKMILVGHSFGAFVSFAYSLVYPKRVAHLICADPWGFNRKPTDLADISQIPAHHRVIIKIMDKLPLNPLWAVRFLGPFGPRLIQKIRSDLIQNFLAFMNDAENKISNYIFHCNAQNPTGESAFRTMMSTFGWAKNPLYLRLESLDINIPLSLIYGIRSWVDHYPGDLIAKSRENSYVDFHILDAGHHVYADQLELFNRILAKACTVLAGTAHSS